MPLKSQLCDPHGQVIEQIVFANLTLPAHIPDAAFRPDVSTEGFQWVRDVRPPLMAPAPDSSAWNALQLPPGFHMTLRSAQTLPGSTQVVDHIVFTDGVASVSVFVEHRETTIQAGGAGAARKRLPRPRSPTSAPVPPSRPWWTGTRSPPWVRSPRRPCSSSPPR